MQPPKANPSHATNAAGVNRSNSHENYNPIDLLLSRLDRVKRTGADKWQALCPAHDDRTPSLAIKEGQDGTVLIKCWAGCSAQAIVEAVELKLSDLFPKSTDYSPAKAPRYSARDVVETLLFESTIVVLGYRTLKSGGELCAKDSARIETAISAIHGCREVVR